MSNRPFVLSIAGLDGCSGAGLSADIKVFENLRTYGLSVCTCITIQNEQEVSGLQWLSDTLIMDQIDMIMKSYSIDYCKIGIIQNSMLLSQVINRLIHHNKHIKIIWDPIFYSSSGYRFHLPDSSLLKDILEKIYLITPNEPEIETLSSCMKINKDEFLEFASNKLHILLKGGHNKSNKAIDRLIIKNSNQYLLEADRIVGSEKHGTGCVLSAAICAQLANGNVLFTACKHAKKYIEQFLRSNDTLLGYHSTN